MLLCGRAPRRMGTFRAASEASARRHLHRDGGGAPSHHGSQRGGDAAHYWGRLHPLRARLRTSDAARLRRPESAFPGTGSRALGR